MNLTLGWRTNASYGTLAIGGYAKERNAILSDPQEEQTLFKEIRRIKEEKDIDLKSSADKLMTTSLQNSVRLVQHNLMHEVISILLVISIGCLIVLTLSWLRSLAMAFSF